MTASQQSPKELIHYQQVANQEGQEEMQKMPMGIIKIRNKFQILNLIPLEIHLSKVLARVILKFMQLMTVT